MAGVDELTNAFLEAACVPRRDGASHASGTLEEAETIRAGHAEVASASIHAAAVLGDDAAVRRFLAADRAAATAKGGPYDWDPLTHLCFSRYLRLDRARSDGLLRAAEALLDAGANPNTGFWEEEHQPDPEWESALYGAAGVAHHEAMTRLLLARGAEPNDGEVPYHAPEGYENGAMQAIVESGRLTADNLAMMLARKADWHDLNGIRWLLAHGADPNRRLHWGNTALHSTIVSDNRLAIIEAMLDHGADPTIAVERSHRWRPLDRGQSAIVMAARRGRGDILRLFQRRGIALDLSGVDRLIAACAMDDEATIRSIADDEPAIVEQLVAIGGQLLAQFSGVGNTAGVRRLLDLGVPVTAPYELEDAYFGITKGSTALHVAAWRAEHDTLRLLLQRGAPVNARDAEGRTPLQLAVRACVDSWWTERRSPDSVDALLRAGASVVNVPYPCGYTEVDELIRQQRAP